MLRIDVYARGAGYRVRVHEHSAGADEQCCDACEDGPSERAYPQRGASPAEERQAVYAAVAKAVGVLGHAEFLRMLRSEAGLW